MPIVRVAVGGSGAESFDTFDVAEMTSNQHAPRQWSSHQAAGGKATATAATTSRLAKTTYKSTCIPTPTETDDMTSIHSSIDSSSGMKSEETDRFDTFTTLYDAMGNLDEMQNDPRNPFNKNQNTRRFGGVDYIPEEDEISLYSMGDSSVAPTHGVQHQSPLNHSRPSYQHPHQSQNNYSRSSSHQLHQTQKRSHRHRQKHPPSTSSDDDLSVSSYQSESIRKGRTSDVSIISQSQLEVQVAKISFELATTKASLDELRLENRRLSIDKSALANDIKVLKEQNEHLHVKIEKLEKERILRSMEGTKGFARIDRESDTTWGGVSVSANTSDGDNGARATYSNQEYMHVMKGPLEIPFTVPDCSYRSGPKRASSFASSGASSYSDDNSTHSIGFEDVHNHPDTLRGVDTVDEGAHEMTHPGRVGILNVMGAGRRPPMGGMTNQRPQSDGRRMQAKEEALMSTGPLLVQDDKNKNYVENNDSGSNPQGNDLNDEDPFATWSAPGDPKRVESELNWLQRGLGFGREKNNPRQHPPPMDYSENSLDPVDDGKQNNGVIAPPKESENYTSFADYSSETSHSSDHDRKGFGLFGFGRRR